MNAVNNSPRTFSLQNEFKEMEQIMYTFLENTLSWQPQFSCTEKNAPAK